MKAFIIGTILLVGLGIGGYIGFQYLSGQSSGQSSTYKTEPVRKTGVIQSAVGDDYSHILVSDGKSIGIASYTVKLGDYTGKKVEVVGQFSGTTLYADTVTIVP